METKKLLTVVEASIQLGLSRTVTYQLIRDGSLRSIKVKRSRRVPVREIDAYIERALEQCEMASKNSLT